MKRIYIFIFGIIVALSLLEAGLRSAGFIYQASTFVSTRLALNNRPKTYVILCLGNSYTKGIGAPVGMSYPVQLQRMLHERMKDENIVVINKGVGSQNSSQLLNDLKFNIDKYSPQLIVLQTGQCNSWNFSNYSDYLRKKNINKSLLDYCQYVLIDLVCKSRVYRLVMLLRNEIRHYDPPVVDTSYWRDKEYARARQYITAVISNCDPDLTASKLRHDKALSIFKSAVKIDPGEARNYLFIGTLYLNSNNRSAALKWYLKAFRVALAGHDSRGVKKAYRFIKNLSIGVNLGAHIDKKLNEILINSRQSSYLISGLDRCDVSEWLESDLREIVGVVKQNKVRLILQNYPKWVFENSIISRVADELKVPFVDNYSSFLEKMREGVKRHDLFVPDTHCTVKGYGLMAGNVFNKILTEGILNVSSRE